MKSLFLKPISALAFPCLLAGLVVGCGSEEQSVEAPQAVEVEEVSDAPPPPPEAELPEGMVAMEERAKLLRPDTNHFVAAPTENMTNAAGAPLSFVEKLRAKAEEGHAESAYFLGHNYYKGNDVTQDFEQAAKWLKVGAERNNAQAQSLLGVLYEEGKGVPQNKPLAYAWYLIAAKQDDALAAERIPLLAEKLNDQDFEEAERLAEGFVPK